MAQTRLDFLRPTQNQNLEFSTSNIHELDFLTSCRKILNLQHLARRILNFFSILSRSRLQDVENSRSYSSHSEARPCKLTFLHFHFRWFVVLNTSDIYLPVQTRTLTTTQAYGMKSVALNKYRAFVHSITLCHIETLSMPTIFAVQGLDCMI